MLAYLQQYKDLNGWLQSNGYYNPNAIQQGYALQKSTNDTALQMAQAQRAALSGLPSGTTGSWISHARRGTLTSRKFSTSLSGKMVIAAVTSWLSDLGRPSRQRTSGKCQLLCRQSDLIVLIVTAIEKEPEWYPSSRRYELQHVKKNKPGSWGLTGSSDERLYRQCRGAPSF